LSDVEGKLQTPFAPAKAGAQPACGSERNESACAEGLGSWVPAFAGTNGEFGSRIKNARAAGKVVAVAVAFLAAWTVIAAAMSFAAPAGTSVAVFGMPGHTLATVAQADGRLVQLGDTVVIARSDAPDFIRKLYAAGALLVLDARIAEGCTGLPPKGPARVAAK
jgi:hypothetical protein